MLQTLIYSRARWPSKKLHTCFVDFRKAFDTIPREKLWRVLEGIGVGGRFLACLQSMYSQDRACVSHPTEGLSSTFPCTIGVKQGCPLSPLLFGLYIDALEPRINALTDDDGPELAGTPVKLLLYADDLVLMSKSSRGLQKQLNELNNFCKERGLTVNVKKTKVVVFGSRVNSSPLLYDGLPVEEVTSFRYLGLELHRTGSLRTAVEHLAAAGRRAVFALRRRCADLKINDPAIVCQLFDALVKPVISYGCELWVNESATESLEILHRSFLKSLLGVNGTTPTQIVLSEFGQFPLSIFWQQQALKYQCRLSSSPTTRLLGLAYEMQQILSSSTPSICCWLAKFQGRQANAQVDVSSTCAKVGEVIKSMQESYLAAPQDGSRIGNYLRLYGNEKYAFQVYLSTVQNVQLRKCLSRFRCSNHCLQIEAGRRFPSNVPLASRICKMCDLGAIEDEDHFLLVCPAYAHLRAKVH